MKLPGIHNAFILIISSLVIFWLITILFFFDRWNNLVHFASVRTEIAEVRYNFSGLRDALDQSIPKYADFHTERDATAMAMEMMRSSLANIENDFIVSGNPAFIRKLNTIKESLNEIEILLSEYELIKLETGTLKSGVLGRTVEIFRDFSKLDTPGFFQQYHEHFISFLLHPEANVLQEILDAWIIRKEQVTFSLPASMATGHGIILGDQVKAYSGELFAGIEQLASLSRKAGSPDAGGIAGDIEIHSRRTLSVLDDMKTFINAEQRGFISKMKRGIIIWLIVSGSLFLYFIYTLSSSIHQRLYQLETVSAQFGSGDIPGEMPVRRKDEIGRIKENFNLLIASLNNKVAFADKIAEGELDTDPISVPEEDILGNSLIKLSAKLAKAEKEESSRKEEEERRRWASEGLANFGDIFRSGRDDVKELAYKVIFNLVKYLGAAAGTIYLANEENPENIEYDMMATFAWERRKYSHNKVQPGEGLIGMCVIEKESVFLTEIPENYPEITSGLAEIKPACLLLVPLKLENEVLGVIEIASVKVFQEFEIRFVEQLGEITATTLATVRINEKTARLLEQSKNQTLEMQQQEEKMRKSVEELQSSQEESLRNESEITGILNAVNASSLVAEFTTNGRFAEINDKWQLLFESPHDQIVGKHHSDFAVTDKYSNEYKQFWRDLREGKTLHKTEKYRLFSGVELWLEQTFSSVKDNEGKTSRILTIAHDITETKTQQEALVKQAAEIKRHGFEMESLTKAVDSSMIQCELTAEGEILSVNNNFVEITGFSKKELIGKNNRIFLRDSEKEQFEKIWSEVLKDKTYSGTIRRTKPTGEEVWILAGYSPVTDESGHIYKVYFLAQDITEKRLKYQLLDEANKEIERLQEILNKP